MKHSGDKILIIEKGIITLSCHLESSPVARAILWAWFRIRTTDNSSWVSRAFGASLLSISLGEDPRSYIYTMKGLYISPFEYFCYSHPNRHIGAVGHLRSNACGLHP